MASYFVGRLLSKAMMSRRSPFRVDIKRMRRVRPTLRIEQRFEIGDRVVVQEDGLAREIQQERDRNAPLQLADAGVDDDHLVVEEAVRRVLHRVERRLPLGEHHRVVPRKDRLHRDDHRTDALVLVDVVAGRAIRPEHLLAAVGGRSVHPRARGGLESAQIGVHVNQLLVVDPETERSLLVARTRPRRDLRVGIAGDVGRGQNLHVVLDDLVAGGSPQLAQERTAPGVW